MSLGRPDEKLGSLAEKMCLNVPNTVSLRDTITVYVILAIDQLALHHACSCYDAVGAEFAWRRACKLVCEIASAARIHDTTCRGHLTADM